MYQTNENNMILDFDTPKSQNFIAIENIRNDIEIESELEPQAMTSQERVEVSSISDNSIKPTIQKTVKSTPSSYEQAQRQNPIQTPSVPDSKGFQTGTMQNNQIQGKGKTSVPRFGMETQTHNVTGVPEWRRIYM